jgi:hypothetical protein
MEYINPWYNKHYGSGQKYFTCDKPPVFIYRDVKVYEFLGTFRYMYRDFCITERAGFNKQFAKHFIDDILDNTETSRDKYGAERCRAIIERMEQC